MTQYQKHFFVFLVIFAFDAKSKGNAPFQCDYDPVYVSKSFNRPNWHRNIKVYISPYKLLSNIEKKNNPVKIQEYMLIDVRPKRKFDDYHINNSFNLPFASLKTQSIFKNKKIVLIGTGSDYKALEVFQEQLISSGFKSVLILDGGINFWKSKIKLRKLKQGGYKLDNINTLINGDNSRWKIVDASNNFKIKELFSNVLSLTSSKLLYKPNSILQLNSKHKRLIENILLVLPKSADRKNIVDVWQAKLNANIYTISANKLSVAINQYANKRKLISQKKRTDGARLSCML